MYDLISIGSISIDLYFKGSSLTKKDNRFYLAIGGKYVCDYFYEGVGGGGANVAIGCTRLGLNTAVLGKVGENVFKQIIIQKLVQRGVSTEFLIPDEDFLNISAILLEDSGERTIIHYVTPHESLNLDEITKKNLLKTKTVYMGNLPNISLKERIDLLKNFKNNNIPVAVNLGVTDCRRPLKEILPLLKLTDIFIVNTHEFADLVKSDYQKIDWKKNCLEILKLDHLILVITDGENGSYLYTKEEIYHQKALKPKKIVDTTGAGDAFVSGFLASYLQKKDLKKAMETATVQATKILEKIGAN